MRCTKCGADNREAAKFCDGCGASIPIRNAKKSAESIRPDRSLTAPSKRRQDATRARILTAGLRLFARRPYEFVTMDDVAQHAGVAKGTLYLYFVSKQALFRGIVSDFVREAERLNVERLTGDPCTDAAERLRRWIIAAIQFYDARRDFVRMLGLDGGRLQIGLIKGWRERGTTLLRSHIEAGMASGVFRRMDSLLASLVISGAMRTLLVYTSERRRLEELAEDLARMMLEWLMDDPHNSQKKLGLKSMVASPKASTPPT
jgi:AcrR family transcriptional regulator